MTALGLSKFSTPSKKQLHFRCRPDNIPLNIPLNISLNIPLNMLVDLNLS
jgi:hypothetical protein